jgi:hypothetical protein
LLNHLHTRVEYAVHLTYYLSLRRHYPDQVHVKLQVVSFRLPVYTCNIQHITYNYNNGFDLSLSFSLVKTNAFVLSFQSKAPLENYGANIEMILGNVINFRQGLYNGNILMRFLSSSNTINAPFSNNSV